MKLATRRVEKVWGRKSLPAPFSQAFNQPVGEIWFEPTAELDCLLAKYLFTGAKLSIQVHPGEGQAGPGLPGKDECWLVLDAEPGASLAIGFREPVGAEAMRSAALDGSIESLLAWRQAGPGDFFYLPAGTVHAIGPGLTLVEIQQNTDVTYRLYDYDRGRELRVDRAVAVARGLPHPAALTASVGPDETACLVDGRYFRLDQVIGVPDDAVARAHGGALLALVLDGSIRIGDAAIGPGECGMATNIADIDFGGAGRCLLVSPR